MDFHSTVAEPRSKLKRGDPVKILKHEAKNARGCDPGEWMQAWVVSNSEAAATVLFRDGTREVIPWSSGRACAAKQ
jgi:hypothetical protein